jgi:hypothetical protein
MQERAAVGRRRRRLQWSQLLPAAAPVSLVEETWRLASSGLAAIAVVVEAEAGPLEGPIMQVTAVGDDVAAVTL